MNYILTENATGAESVHAFTQNDFHKIVGVDSSGPTRDQARRQIAIWNRSQSVHRQEFSYRLTAEGGATTPSP